MEQLIEFFKGLFKKDFWKSTNFWLTIVAVLIVFFKDTVGIDLSDMGLDKLAEAIGSGDPEAVLIAFLSVINSIYHLFLKDKVVQWVKNIIDSFYKKSEA